MLHIPWSALMLKLTSNPAFRSSDFPYWEPCIDSFCDIFADYYDGSQWWEYRDLPRNDLRALSTDTMVWTDLSRATRGAPPGYRYDPKMVASGGQLFVYGGVAGATVFKDLHSFAFGKQPESGTV